MAKLVKHRKVISYELSSGISEIEVPYFVYNPRSEKEFLVIFGGLAEGNKASEALAKRIVDELGLGVVTFDVDYHKARIKDSDDIEIFARSVASGVINDVGKVVTLFSHSGSTVPALNLLESSTSINRAILLSPLSLFGLAHRARRKLLSIRYVKYVFEHAVESLLHPADNFLAVRLFIGTALKNTPNFNRVFELISTYQANTDLINKSNVNIYSGEDDALMKPNEIALLINHFDLLKKPIGSHYHIASSKGTLQAFEAIRLSIGRGDRT